jgi:phage portal protein BeeE
VIVHRAVKLVPESAASVSFIAYEGAEAREPHPLTDLLKRPNPRQEQAAFLEAVCAHLLLAGNAYIEAVTADGADSRR